MAAARRGHPRWPLASSFLTTFVLRTAAFAPALRPPAATPRWLRLQVCAPCGLQQPPAAPRSRMTSRHWLSRHASVAPGAGQDLGELFDLYEAPQPSVSEFRGEPTRKGVNKARKQVHADGDWHRAVHIWLYSSQGNLVLQKRSDSKDTFPGRWDVSVGGHVTSGDTVMQTALKEVEEELGLGIEEAELEYLGTLATTAKGSSPISGSFMCNEYKDLFLLKFDGSVAGASACVWVRALLRLGACALARTNAADMCTCARVWYRVFVRTLPMSLPTQISSFRRMKWQTSGPCTGRALSKTFWLRCMCVCVCVCVCVCECVCLRVSSPVEGSIELSNSLNRVE